MVRVWPKIVGDGDDSQSFEFCFIVVDESENSYRKFVVHGVFDAFVCFLLILVICGFDWICIVQMMFFMFIFFCGFRSENVKEESELWFVVYSTAAANDWGIISLPSG